MSRYLPIAAALLALPHLLAVATARNDVPARAGGTCAATQPKATCLMIPDTAMIAVQRISGRGPDTARYDYLER